MVCRLEIRFLMTFGHCKIYNNFFQSQVKQNENLKDFFTIRYYEEDSDLNDLTKIFNKVTCR